MRRVKAYMLAMLLFCAATNATAEKALILELRPDSTTLRGDGNLPKLKEPVKALILEQKPGSITFRVDLNLPKPQNPYFNGMSQADRLESIGSSKYYDLDNSYIAASFWDTPMMVDDTPFFTGMVRAFADHRPITLSPDVIWMLISQAFSHDVNANPEKFRDKFVDFDGKMDLVVQAEYPLYHPDFDWTAIVDGFAEEIDANTKNDVARLITADFSTTGTIERMASEIVLMETTKFFFEFIIMYAGCGFPSITLTGTVEDWQAIADKTERLRELGAGSWASDLKPILKQFVQAAQGNPDRAFWQDIVMKDTPDDCVEAPAQWRLPLNLTAGSSSSCLMTKTASLHPKRCLTIIINSPNRWHRSRSSTLKWIP